MTRYSIEFPPSLLCEGDEVQFTVQGRQKIYTVYHSYLNQDCRNDGSDNGWIFEQLRVSATSMARDAYGYGDMGGDWPSFKRHDLLGATRLVLALYELQGGPSTKGKVYLTLVMQSYLIKILSEFYCGRAIQYCQEKAVYLDFLRENGLVTIDSQGVCKSSDPKVLNVMRLRFMGETVNYR